MYCVYIHTNKVNGKMYIGITSHEDNPNKRWGGGHRYAYNMHFYNAIKKYGWDMFKHEIFAKNLSLEDALAIEMLLIEYFQTTNPKNGYNQTAGGSGTKSLSEDARKRHSRAIKRYYVNNPDKRRVLSEKMSGENNPMYGKNLKDHMTDDAYNKWLNHLKNPSDDTRKKMSENHADFSGNNHYNYGKHLSEETKNKIRKTVAEKGNNAGKLNPNYGNHKLAHGNNPRAKTIYCVELDELFWGFTDAQNRTGVYHAAVADCCKHKRETTISHCDEFTELHWFFADEAVYIGIISKDRLDAYNGGNG